MAMKIFTLLCVITLSLLITGCSATKPAKLRHAGRPCKELVVYIHDIIYTGNNFDNATSAIIGEPDWANKTSLTYVQNLFGDMVVFDDPLTADNNFHSPPIGRAYGFYLYTKKDTRGAWHGFSIYFNSTEHKGILNFAGLNLLLNETRDISVIGGTGDFFMSRGVATFTTDAYELDNYFSLRIDIKLYECWKLDS